ncbi:MAG: tryptophan-rich sensory protein [Clostridia bacterium]|nr:tryptophan-rich sensory protein [Clostridia bacterium]
MKSVRGAEGGAKQGAKSEPFRPAVLAGFIGFTLAFGFIGAWLGGFIGGSSAMYRSLVQPPLAPPAILFPIVWSILYVLMAVAAYLAWAANPAERATAMRWYVIQLVINALWPLFFFRLGWFLIAFFWLLLLIAAVALTMVGFRYLSKTAFRLMIPYMLWLLFAAYLNLGVYLLNP